MEYKTIELNELNNEDIQRLIGAGSKNINVLKDLYKVDINFRSNELMFYSNDNKLFNIFEKHIKSLTTLILGKVDIDESAIRQSYISITNDIEESWQNKICCYSFNNKPFTYKTYNQYKLSKIIDTNDSPIKGIKTPQQATSNA